MRRGTYEKYANPLQGCLFLVLHPNESVSGIGSRNRENVVLGGLIECAFLTWKYCYPPSCGFPPKSFPLKGNPPFQGTPSALGHEGVRGRRLRGAAMLCRLQCARFAKRVAHCRRTFRQPSALIRSPPTFKRRQAACESLAGRLHFELDNIVSCDVTLGVFVKLSNVHLFGASPSTMKPLSKTVLRAAHSNLHSGRLRPLLQVAARFATSQARRIIK